MKIEIDQETLQRTKHCTKDLRCLKGDMEDVCGVIRTIGSRIIVTFCAAKEPCPYCQGLKGIEGICICPTRIEIYNRYGI